MQAALDGIIEVMDFALGARDPYTVGHQQRTTRLACALGRELGLKAERLAALRLAGSLHDLGKIAVPSEILSKPGKLSEIEFAMIKTHPQVAHDMLQPIKCLSQVCEMILQHHERMDGSGYPQGLKGKDILLEARILGVADVIEAMCSHRPYRPGLGLNRALEEISRHRGSRYDSAVVDAALRLLTGDQQYQILVGQPSSAPSSLAGNRASVSGENVENRKGTAPFSPRMFFRTNSYPPLGHVIATSILAGIILKVIMVAYH